MSSELLMQNRTPSSRKSYTILVEANSRDRNCTHQASSNPLKFTFARPIKDIRSVEILSGTIPANPFCINPYNNTFTFKEGSAKWTIVIPPGAYTAQQLVTYLESTLNSLPSIQNTYSLSLNSEGRLDISGNTQPYSFLFATGSQKDVMDPMDGFFLEMNTPASILGFRAMDYDSSGGLIRSPYPVDPYTALTRLYLYVNFDNTKDLGCIERGAGRRSPFAIIYLDSQNDGYKFLNKETLSTANYSLPQPHARLQSLNIEFRDEFYRLVDFNGKEFSLLLQLTVLE